MEDGPDSEPNSTIRFITGHQSVFPEDEVVLPDDHCSLVAVAAKYGLIFVGCGTVIKVYETKIIVDAGEKNPLITISTGAVITHVSSSCDGLTLLVIILHNNVPHALFYEIRNFLPQCAEQKPFFSTIVSAVSGTRVQGLAWHPLDCNSVAVATSPGSLLIITLKDNDVTIKLEDIKACAVGWSPKGKQLTVGLADGSLSLYKPDLTTVRSVPRPPVDNIGPVLSITWFTSTEFFISYKIDSEDIGHVMMYVNAPKNKTPRFVTYDYLCNYNQGPRPPMFYPVFFAEWSLLCVLSSRAIQLGVLGRPEKGGDAWCEYEMEEGAAAEVHNVSVTKETFPLGLAVDFTSQKVFTQKDETMLGPCPVIYTLSTGGEVNMFHAVNCKPDAQSLISPLESLPKSGHRSPQQYGGAASYTVPAVGAPADIPRFSASAPSDPLPLTLNVPGTTAASAPQTKGAFPVTSLFSSSTPGQQVGTPGGQKLSFTQQIPNTAKPSFSLAKMSSSPFAPSSPPTVNSGSTSGIFGTLKQPMPSSLFSATFNPPGQSAISASGVLTSSTIASPATPFSLEVKSEASKASLAGTNAPQISANTIGQGIKFTPFQLPQANSAAGSISQGKPALNPVSQTPLKPKSPSVTSDTPKQADNQSSSKSQSPAPVLQPASGGKEMDEGLISTIKAATYQFYDELQGHINMNQSSNEIGKQHEMGSIRQSLKEESEWISQMSTTTSELTREVTDLHSEVVDAYTLLEEAEAQLNKSKNPRHFLSLQSRPLDPHSRKKIEEIRSLYQYLQSQLVEVNTRLHLDWVAFSNNMKNKKKQELPETETLYQALRKYLSLRRVRERQVSTMCDQFKALQLNFLAFGLATSRRQYDDDDTLANLERTLRETTLSPTTHVSPFKMLPPKKQSNLQRALAQRHTIPLRKCANLPKMDLHSLESLSSSCSHDGSPDISSGSHQVQHPFSSNLENSLSASFGPQTFSTPNRNNSVSPVNNGVTPAKQSITGGNVPSNTKPCYAAEVSSQFIPVTQLGDSVPSTSIAAPKSTSFSAVPGNLGNGTSGFSFTNVTISGSKVNGTEPVYVTGMSKPQYEDITPPQTPDNKIEVGMKTASPLLALSSLVSKVPTTTVADTNPPSTVSDTKPTFKNTFGVNASSDGTKVQAADVVTPSLPAFSHKPLSSASLKTTLQSSISLSFTPFSPPSTNFSATPVGSSSDKIPSASASTSSLFKLPSTSVESTKVTTEASLACVTSSSMFSFKSPTSITTPSNMAFSFKPPTSLNSQLTSVTTTSSEGPLAGTSSFSAMLSKPGNIFGGVIAGTPEVGSLSSCVVTTISFTSPSMPTTTTSSVFSLSSETTPTVESDSSSSTSGDSDTASNTTIVADNAGSAGGSDSVGQEASSVRVLEKQASSTTSVTPVPVISTMTSTPSILPSEESVISVAHDDPVEVPSSSDISEKKTESESPSLFAGNTSTVPAKLFSNSASSASSVFGSSTTPGSLFGGTPSVFGGTSAASGGIFGTTTSSVSGSIFGGTTTPSSKSIFGSTTVTTSGSLLGGTPTSSSIIIGTSSSSTATSTTSSDGVFSSPPTTVSGGLFGMSSVSLGGGSSTSSIPSTGSIFATSTSSSTGSLFGTSTATASGTGTTTFGQTSAFGAPTTSNSGSAFSSLSSAASGFSLNTTTTTTAVVSAFGQTSTQGSTSVFGQSTQSSSGSLFGTPSTTGSVFGSTGQSGSLFGSPPSQGTGIFGGSSTPSTGSSLFGQPTTSSGFSSESGEAVFGQSSAAISSPFSTTSTTKPEPTPFGSSSGFGTGTNSGGGFFSGLGSKPSEDSANKNIFGSTSFSSGKPQASNSLFGGTSTTSNPFGNASVFGGNTGNGNSGSFSSGAGQVNQSGFGVTSPQTPSVGFGSASTFGSSPAFGGAPAFASPPKFGSSPTFGGTATFSSPVGGSPGGGFSNFASSGGSTFGSVTSPTSGTGSGFGSFSSQNNTASFGGLAQSASQQQPGNAFGSSGSVFGSGSNFSSWR